MTDQFTGIFDDITPDHFAPHQGELAFESFVARQVEMAQYAWLAAEGDINPVATLTTPAAKHLFVPTEHENLGQYVQRLGRNAEALGATWLFISYTTTLTVGPPSPYAINDPEALKQMTESGTAQEGLYYYAERIDGGVRSYRHGVMLPTDGRLGDPTEGHPAQQADFFASILSY